MKSQLICEHQHIINYKLNRRFATLYTDIGETRGQEIISIDGEIIKIIQVKCFNL
jgi:hypothetical protein